MERAAVGPESGQPGIDKRLVWLGKLYAQTKRFHLEKIGVEIKIDWTRDLRGLKFNRRDHHSSCYHSRIGFGSFMPSTFLSVYGADIKQYLVDRSVEKTLRNT